MLESDVNSIRTRDGAGMKVRPVNFNSDNVASASSEILAALVAANHGAVASYGDDPITSRLEARFRDLFDTFNLERHLSVDNRRRHGAGALRCTACDDEERPHPR